MIKNTIWFPPPAAWTIGASLIEKALNIASNLDHSVVARLIKGEPEAKQLWSKDISLKISLPKLELYIVRFSNGTSNIRVTPISTSEELRAERTHKVGSLPITLIQEKRTSRIVSYYHFIVFGLIAALITVAVLIILQRQEKA